MIRLIRYWNQESNHERLSGYHVEVMTLRILEEYELDQRRDAVAYVFNQLPQAICNPCPTQTGFGASQIDADLSPTKRESSARSADLARIGSAIACKEELSENHSEAIEWWGRVFGPKFPKP